MFIYVNLCVQQDVKTVPHKLYILYFIILYKSINKEDNQCLTLVKKKKGKTKNETY